VEFNGVKTNIETQEQYEKLLEEMVKFFMKLKHPDYKVVRIEKSEANDDKRIC